MSRTVRLVVLLVALTTVASTPVVSADERSRPDIVVVMVDDFKAMDNRVLERLPNIRELFLDNGLRFDAAYSETPLCCPGRASVLTGQHTRRHRVFTNGDILKLDPTYTVATALDDAGYYTMMVGKYLNKTGLLADKTPPGWDRVAMKITSGTKQGDWAIDDQIMPTSTEYDDRFIAQKSAQWLAEAPVDQPAFLFVGPGAPHPFAKETPWIPRIEARYVDDERCAGIEPWKPPTYAYPTQPDGWPLDEVCRSLLTVDDMVGDVRTVAAERGRDTVWMFTADNGMAYGEKGFTWKNVPESGRLPVYFAGVGVTTGATSALVSNIDFGPTLAEVGGTTMPYADGVSFAALLGGGSGGRDWLFEDHPKGGYTGGSWTGPWWGVRTARWHLVKIGSRKPKLFDLAADPWETRNVRAERPGVVRKLRSLAAPLLY